MDQQIKKNVLDLHYSKHLQYKVTAIILATTYIFAVAIAWFTQELKLNDSFHMSVLGIASIVTLTPCVYTIINSGKHLGRIIDLVKKLK